MKILEIVLVAAIIIFCLIGCSKAVEDSSYRYRTTGNFAGWGSNYEQNYMMTNISRSDTRIKVIKGELKNAMYIYIYEYTPNSANPAGWTIHYPGAGISLDGNYAVKIIRLAADTFEQSGWMFDMWIPSTESGGLKNLSPDTMYVPSNRSDEARDAVRDGLGSNNDNPVLLKGAQTYYIVFAVFKDKSRGIGAVVKSQGFTRHKIIQEVT